MSTNLNIESSDENLVHRIIVRLELFGVKLGQEHLKRLNEMSVDELVKVAVDVGIYNHRDTNPVAAKLGSLGTPTRSDEFFASLLNSTGSRPNDSSQDLFEQFSGPNSRSAPRTLKDDGTSLTLP